MNNVSIYVTTKTNATVRRSYGTYSFVIENKDVILRSCSRMKEYIYPKRLKQVALLKSLNKLQDLLDESKDVKIDKIIIYTDSVSTYSNMKSNNAAEIIKNVSKMSEQENYEYFNKLLKILNEICCKYNTTFEFKYFHNEDNRYTKFCIEHCNETYKEAVEKYKYDPEKTKRQKFKQEIRERVTNVRKQIEQDYKEGKITKKQKSQKLQEIKDKRIVDQIYYKYGYERL